MDNGWTRMIDMKSVVFLNNKNRAKDFIEIGIDAEEYYRIKDSEKNADE